MIIDNKQTLEVIMSGMTHYVDLGASEPAAIYYRPDNTSHMRLPEGKIMHGTWKLAEAGYDVDWANGPATFWQFDFEPGRISYIDENGANQGPIVRMVAGDPENIA